MMTTIESIPFRMTEKQMDEAYGYYKSAVVDVANYEELDEVDVLERIAKAFFNMQKPSRWEREEGIEDTFWRDMWLASSFNYAHSCYGLYRGIVEIVERAGLNHLVNTKKKRQKLELRVNKCINGFMLAPQFANPSHSSPL
jgi:hypothetical protein